MNANEFVDATWQDAPAEIAAGAKILAPPAGRLVSLSMPAPGMEALHFLGQAQGEARVFWQNGQDQIAFAGFGVAAEMMAWGDGRFQDIERKARRLFEYALVPPATDPLATPRLFGGFAFRDDFTPDNTWSVFHPAHFILPHYQLAQHSDASWLTINAIAPPEENPEDIMPQLREALEARFWLLRETAVNPGINHPALQRINYPMPYEVWAQKIENARQVMHAGELQKVVLARMCEIWLEQRAPINGIIEYLNTHYAGCYRFLFEPRPNHAFYGATPELLARVNGRFLTTMGLAGSICRGKSSQADQKLAQTLLQSSKDRREHDLVVRAIEERLTPFAAAITMPPEPDIYQLSYIQHLYTPIQATLKETTGILPIVAALHPTPALGGAPRREAMEFIRQAEAAPRGWFAAPIGWIDNKLDGEFGVAIRSAVCQQRRIWLYAGAGIVADSDPQSEWDETELKFQPMLNAVGIL